MFFQGSLERELRFYTHWPWAPHHCIPGWNICH